MRLSKSWIIAAKDFKMFMKKKNIIYSIVGSPTHHRHSSSRL